MKDIIFFDTNVMLDFLGERLNYYDSVAKIVTLADLGKVKIVASSLSYATVNYFLCKFEGTENAKLKLRKFKIVSTIVGVDETTIEKGLNSNFKDFEDALQYYSALDAKCTILITRNIKDFKNSRLPVMTPLEYLMSIK